jgi:hypothetical protein
VLQRPKSQQLRDRQKMVEIAERVSQDFSSLRVDFFMASNA